MTTFLLLSTSAQPHGVANVQKTKVADSVWQVMQSNATADIIVNARGYPNLSPARMMHRKEDKTQFVYKALSSYANTVQANLRRELTQRGTPFTVLWISNSLAIKHADSATLSWLSARNDVASIALDQPMRAIESHAEDTPAADAIQNGIEWNINMINAPQVWAQGYRGQGVVIADLDTGVHWQHSMLKNQYRGWNGEAVDHNYNWFDPIGETINEATDDDGHGTHTIGTVVGDDGMHQIGVAPDAQWIACRNMDHGYGSVARYAACFQFALAPTDVNGNTPDPSRAADITTNSWGCEPRAPYLEPGCDDPAALVAATQALRDAGIMVVAAAGNDGTLGCSSVINAPGTLDQALSVGAIDATGRLAAFSSRGPSTFTGKTKPDVVAPGVSVYSADWQNSLGLSAKSGTSMATPHVAGVVALMWSAAPWLRGNIDDTERILRESATPMTSTQLACGNVPNSTVPNNLFGYGLVNAAAAVGRALKSLDVHIQAPLALSANVPANVTVSAHNQYSNMTVPNATLLVVIPRDLSVVDTGGGESATLLNGDTQITWHLGDIAGAQSAARTLKIVSSVDSYVSHLTAEASAFGDVFVGEWNLRRQYVPLLAKNLAR